MRCVAKSVQLVRSLHAIDSLFAFIIVDKDSFNTWNLTPPNIAEVTILITSWQGRMNARRMSNRDEMSETSGTQAMFVSSAGLSPSGGSARAGRRRRRRLPVNIMHSF